tara:strand:- start:4009 stop:4623 length:615 start_codon:yes stop_codon:yes gene_type:complete
MSNMTLNNIEIQRWFRDKGDYTHNITYPLNGDSVVMDLGGYTGVWAQQIIDKYDPKVYIIEPIEQFHEGMVKKFSDNDKVNLLNVGISPEDSEGIIYMDGDGTSSNIVKGEGIKVTFNSMETLLSKWGLDFVDLIQINIEGDEYILLEKMIETGVINKFKNVQVQFHLGIDDCENKRNKIREDLIKLGYKLNFDYPFVWESWGK